MKPPIRIAGWSGRLLPLILIAACVPLEEPAAAGQTADASAVCHRLQGEFEAYTVCLPHWLSRDTIRMPIGPGHVQYVSPDVWIGFTHGVEAHLPSPSASALGVSQEDILLDGKPGQRVRYQIASAAAAERPFRDAVHVHLGWLRHPAGGGMPIGFTASAQCRTRAICEREVGRILDSVRLKN